jgi:RNA 2',3'-cyclic 3'-phosphodiesterase
MIRLFAALEVPEDIGRALQRRQQGLPGARWRSLDQLHITLRFFGEVPEPQAAEIDDQLSRIRGEPLEITLQGVGAFGEGAAVRSVYAKVVESPALARLAARCEAAARKAGLKGEARGYCPHVTLAYLKRSDPGRVAAWIQGHNLLHSPPFHLAQFGLYSSWASPDGSRYDLERSYPLT